jgi:hypothetical protein
MNKKVIFKIDKDLDFKNHLIGAKAALNNICKMSPETIEYFKKLRDANKEDKIKIFNERTLRFYSHDMINFRTLFVKQTQEMWDLIESKYFSKIEEIHKQKFPLETISGVLSTNPSVYGYNFNEENPWFACPCDYPIKAVNTAMHEIMHTFFHKYFWEEYKNKFQLKDEQIYIIKESVTVILDLELSDIKMLPDKGHLGHEIIREKIKEDWLKYKDFKKVLEEACHYIKNL